MFSSVQLISHVRFFVTQWTGTHQAPLSSTVSWSLHKFMSIESVKILNHLILCHSLLLLLSIFPSISSVQFSCSVMSDSLRPHRLQHARLLCPPLSPGVYSHSCPLSWWCYITISSSAAPFSFCLQFFSALGPFPMSWLFASGGQSTGASASASVR